MTSQKIREAIDTIDHTIAVERAMTFSERLNFYARQSGTGAPNPGRDGIADWISDANDRDHALHIVEPWWDLYGRPAHDILRDSGLPSELIQPIIVAALYACIGAGLVDDYRRGAADVIGLAQRAAIWACGALEARGWFPGSATGKLAPPPVVDQEGHEFTMRWEAPIPTMTTQSATSLMERMATGPLKLTSEPGGPTVGQLHDVAMVDGTLVGRGIIYSDGPLSSLLNTLDRTMRCSIGLDVDPEASRG